MADSRSRWRIRIISPAGRSSGAYPLRAGHAHGLRVGFDLAHAAGNLVLKAARVGCRFRRMVHLQVSQMAGREALPVASFTSGTARDESLRGLPDGGAMSWRPASAWVPIFTPRPRRGMASEQSASDRAGGRCGTFHGSVRRGPASTGCGAKSVERTGYLESALDPYADRGFSIVTPRDPGTPRRARFRFGARLRALPCANAWAAGGVVCDWREPDILARGALRRSINTAGGHRPVRWMLRTVS